MDAWGLFFDAVQIFRAGAEKGYAFLEKPASMRCAQLPPPSDHVFTRWKAGGTVHQAGEIPTTGSAYKII